MYKLILNLKQGLCKGDKQAEVTCVVSFLLQRKVQPQLTQDLIIDCFTESEQKPAGARTWDQSEEREIYIHNLLNMLAFTVYTLKKMCSYM